MHKTRYKIEWRPTSAGWDMPFVDGEEIDPNALKFVERANELEAELEKKEAVLEKVLDLIYSLFLQSGLKNSGKLD